MTKRKPTKHEDDVRRGLRTAQYNGIIDTQLKTIDDLKAEVERLRKAGDAMADALSPFRVKPFPGPYLCDLQQGWESAKEGKPSGCLVNPSKVAQYLPKPPAAKEGKPSV